MLCLCLSWLSFVAASQVLPHFAERISTEQGLSSNNIYDIVQDDNDFLWIATPDGLNRYDGTEVIQFFHHANTNSLPHNYVYCLKKLSNNYLAIGTQGGLAFYDCNTGIFKNYYYKKNAVLDEYNNAIIELEIDATGKLWATSRNCIFIFDANRKLQQIIPSPFTAADAASQRLRFVEKVFPLSNGDMLLYLFNGWHIYSLKSNTILSYDSTLKKFKFLNQISPPQVNKYFSPAHLFKIFNNFFLVIPPVKDSLFLFDEAGKKLNSCYFPYNQYPNVWWSQHISQIDSSNLLFLMNENGFAMLSVYWKNHKPILQNTSSLLFNDQEYNTTFRDNQNNWWLATKDAGLQKISPYKQYFMGDTLTGNSGRPIKSEIVTINKFNNKLWISSYGDGFFENDITTGKQQQHIFNNTGNDMWANYIWNVRPINNDTIWVGTQAGIFWYAVSSKKFGRIPAYTNKPAAVDSVPITTQFTDSYNLTWMGLGRGQGLCSFDNNKKFFTYYAGSSKNGYPLRYPTSIAEDNKSNLWFVSDGNSVLTHWNRKTNLFETINLPYAEKNQVGSLNGICCEGDSVLWIGSITCGLIKFNYNSNIIKVYGHENGLNNSHITSIFEDHLKRLWLITDGGLACFNQTTESFINYTAKDGLPVKYPTDYFFYDATSNLLYGGGNGKIFYFNPDAITFSQPPKKTIITGMYVNGKSYMLNEKITAKFKYNQNDISIQYTSVDLVNGAQTNYAYKLIGEDTGWIMLGNQRQINFSHLAPGHYTFLVRAGNSSGTWNQQPSSINFIINAPFTQTIWFYILLLIVAAAIFYLFYRFRLQQLMQTELVRSEISKNLHDEVGSNLTNISLSTLLAQKQIHNRDSVTRLLQKIYEDSQTVSEAMREIVWSVNPKIDTLGEALPRMLRYASELLEANGIELHAEIAPEAEQLKLNMKERHDVYLIFKEAINNIAKHSKAKIAQVKIYLANNKFAMKINDDGKGFDATASFINNGLKNMKERAQLNKWTLQLQSQNNQGTTILLNT